MRYLSLLFLSFFILPLMAMNSSATIVVMLGAPGSGKGTQAVQLSRELDLPHISTGDLFRENLKNHTPLGEEAARYMNQGQLVPDSLVLDMLFSRLQSQDTAKGYILDGFPRTIPQAETLAARLPKDACIVALSLEVPDEIIVERITGRLVCASCGAPYHAKNAPPKEEGICDRCGGKLQQRKDDTEEVVIERLKIFHAETEPLKEFYKSRAKLFLIDGTKSPSDVLNEAKQDIAKACSSN